MAENQVGNKVENPRGINFNKIKLKFKIKIKTEFILKIETELIFDIEIKINF